jgi:hypothetical protein
MSSSAPWPAPSWVRGGLQQDGGVGQVAIKRGFREARIGPIYHRKPRHMMTLTLTSDPVSPIQLQITEGRRAFPPTQKNAPPPIPALKKYHTRIRDLQKRGFRKPQKCGLRQLRKFAVRTCA